MIRKTMAMDIEPGRRALIDVSNPNSIKMKWVDGGNPFRRIMDGSAIPAKEIDMSLDEFMKITDWKHIFIDEVYYL